MTTVLTPREIKEVWDSLEHPNTSRVRRVIHNSGRHATVADIVRFTSDLGGASRHTPKSLLGLLDELVPVLTGDPTDRLADLMREVYRAVP